MTDLRGGAVGTKGWRAAMKLAAASLSRSVSRAQTGARMSVRLSLALTATAQRQNPGLLSADTN